MDSSEDSDEVDSADSEDSAPSTLDDEDDELPDDPENPYDELPDGPYHLDESTLEANPDYQVVLLPTPAGGWVVALALVIKRPR